MAISKVVYGTKILVDLTSDTVDAAHLAKGRTAHDAAGNLIVGTLEQQGQQQGGGNLLSGITPTLLNGTTQNGKSYVIPSVGSYNTVCISYQLNMPTLASHTAYCLFVYGKTSEKHCTLKARLYFQNPDGSSRYANLSTSLFIDDLPGAQAGSFELASGVKPTRMEILANTTNGPSASISNITLVKLDT